MAYDGFFLTYKNDRETNERYDKIQKKYPNFRMVKINLEDWNDPKITSAIKKIGSVANTKHFWVIDPDVEVDLSFDYDFQTNEWDEDIIHVWNAEERNVWRSVVGVKLFKTSEVLRQSEAYIKDAYYLTGEFKSHDSNNVVYKPTTETYDIFYWEKDFGVDNLNKLRERFPEIKTVAGETNIDVHSKCRDLARTDFYYLIHPNTEVFDTFKFDYSFAFGLDKEKQKVVVWQKQNPMTNLTREYHGLGLFPKEGPMFKEREYEIFNFRKKAVYEKDAICKDLEFPIIRTRDMHDLSHKVDTDMYWLIHEDVEEFTTEYYPFSYDREFIHNFRVMSGNNEVRNGIRLVPNKPDEDKQKDMPDCIGTIKQVPIISASTLQGGIDSVETFPALIVDPAVELDSNYSFYPDLYDLATAHALGKGVVFVAGDYDEYNMQFYEDAAEISHVPDYDIYFWDRGFGNNNFTELQQRFPRIQSMNTETLTELHEYAQKNSTYNYYYVITSDTTVTDFNFDYEFDFSLTEASRQQIVVWQKTDYKNNIIEYQGIGLFRKDFNLFTENKYQRFDFRRKALYIPSEVIKPVEYDLVRTDNLMDLSQIKSCDTEMVWLVSNDVDDFVTDYYPMSYDKDNIHNFKVTIGTTEVRNGIRLVPRNYDEEKQKDVDKVLGSLKRIPVIHSSTLKGGLSRIETYPTIIVDPAIESKFNLEHTFGWYPDLYDMVSAHVLSKGLIYIASEYDQFNIKEHELDMTYIPDYDIFFWDKGWGEDNFKELQNKFEHRIKKLSGNALEVHEQARKKSKYNYYYIITPDTAIWDFKFDYEFKFSMTEEARQQIVVWQRTNKDGTPREYYGLGLFRVDIDLFTESQYDKFNFKRKAIYEQNDQVHDVEFPIIRTKDLFDLDNKVDTAMYWLIHEDVKDFDCSYYPMLYDSDAIHNFKVNTSTGMPVRNGIRLVPRNPNEEKQKDIDLIVGKLKEIEIVEARTLEEAVELANNYTFWMVNPDLQLINPMIDDYYPDLYNLGPSHIWKQRTRKGKDLGHGGLAFSNKDYHSENVNLHDEYGMRVPDKHNIKKYFTRDPFKAYKQSKGRVFYWVIDTAVELLDTFEFDYYPDIFSIENVFAFKSEEGKEAGVYLVHRPHLEKFNPSEEDFSFDRFKNIIRVDEIASRVVGHPAFYFDEGMYQEHAKYFNDHKNIDVIDASKGLAKAYMKASGMSKSGYFWAINNDVELTEDFSRTFYVDRHHKSHFHLWPKSNPYTGYVHQYGGLSLIPTAALKELKPDDDKLRKMNFKNKKPVKSKKASSKDIAFDVVFLSYREKEAEENYAKLLSRVPNAKRVHGVKGIFNAHKKAAEIADTKMFYVLDADAIITDEFEFEYFPTVWDEDAVHVWKSKNPINGLIYGFGGLKLFPTQLVRDAKDWNIDFTTSISDKFKPMPVVANYTAFNTNPYDTWKSAFRECTKLSSSIIHNRKEGDDNERLNIWCTVADENVPYGKYSIAGANAGRKFGSENAGNPEKLGLINDYDWLTKQFKQDFNDE